MSLSTLNGDKFTSYITIENDTWAGISLKAYGDATKYNIIIAANFGLPITPIVKSGIKIRIPIIEIADTEETNKDLLPPWKRYPAENEKQAAAAVPAFLNPVTTTGGSFDGSFD